MSEDGKQHSEDPKELVGDKEKSARNGGSSEEEKLTTGCSNSSNVSRRRILEMAGAGAAGAIIGAGTVSADHGSKSDANTSKSPEELVAEMTLDEKIQEVHGHQGSSTGYIPPIPRLGIPDVKMSDGPVGIRHNTSFEREGTSVGLTSGPGTAFPAGISQAATFDLDLVRQFGVAVAREAKAKDQDVWLAPGINIVRVPELGRGFEYYGEDPYLTSRMAVDVIEAVQENGIIATAKHYVANNQEGKPVTEQGNGDGFVAPGTAARSGARHYVSAEVSDRALHEIYMPAFRAAVEEADVGAIMGAYNRVNGTYACEHRHLLLEDLKDEWDFDGYVVSDWTGTRPQSAQNGLDIEMPAGVFFDEPLKRQVQAGTISEETLDDKVVRLLRQLDRMGTLDGNKRGEPGAANTDEHQELARRIAAEGAVLLKNDTPGLPLDLDTLNSVAVIGHKADEAKVGGGGSSNVTPPYSVSPLQAIKEYAGDAASVLFERGQSSTAAAADLAADADIAIVFAQGSSSEGRDRKDISLDGNQNQLIADVAAANDHTIVVLNTGGPIVMPWVDDVPAILQMWYPGMEDGHATVDVLFDEVTPGGKLPVTFGKSRDDYPANERREYPGVAGQAHYTEGVFVGYRYFDDRANEPLFPFGHGLSYTEFAYRDITVTAGDGPHEATVEATVENIGDHAGKEVAQLYVHDLQASVPRPPKELKGFEKVHLDPGESTTVTFELDADAFAFYNDRDADDWVVDPGWFSLLVGSSSRDVHLVENVQLTDNEDVVTLAPSVTRSDDGSAFTGGQTNRVDISVEADQPVIVRDRIPVDWSVVEGDPHTVTQVGDTKYVTFDESVENDTMTFYAEAPSGPTESGPHTFGPVAVSLDGQRWSTISSTTDDNVLVGQSTNV